MRRPSIRILQDFTRQYFPSRCPIVKWKKMDYKHVAMMDLKTNIICLNPKNGLDDYGCNVGALKYKPNSKEKITYRWGEQYFHALLHEIAHFKIKKKPPIEWINLMGKHLRVVIENENTRRRNLGDKPLIAKEEKEYIFYYLDNNYLGNNVKPVRRKGESGSH